MAGQMFHTDVGRRVYDNVALLFPRSCPYRMMRIGGNTDGAYLIPDDLSGVSACFSPGVANFKWFEDELANLGIRCHMADFSSDADRLATPLLSGMQTFLKKWISPDPAENSISIDDWVNQLEPGEDDLLLQMDIEGAEYPNLLSVSEAVLRRFRILVLELHDIQVCYAAGEFLSRIAPVIQRISMFFETVHVHVNNVGGSERIDGTGLEVPRIIEVTLLRKDRFPSAGHADWRQPVIPHPLDLDVNCPHIAPLCLSEEWCLSEESRQDWKQSAADVYGRKAGLTLFEVLERIKHLELENVNLRRRLDQLSLLSRLLRFGKKMRQMF